MLDDTQIILESNKDCKQIIVKLSTRIDSVEGMSVKKLLSRATLAMFDKQPAPLLEPFLRHGFSMILPK